MTMRSGNVVDVPDKRFERERDRAVHGKTVRYSVAGNHSTTYS